ncbi:hypothetical protein UlMin_004496 [Ulmus minor]
MAPRKSTNPNKTAEITKNVNNLCNMVHEHIDLIREQARLLKQLVKEHQDYAGSSIMSGNMELVELRQMMVSQTEESRGHARMIKILLKRLNNQEQQNHGNNDSGICNNPRNGDPICLGNGNLNNQLVNIEPLYERFRKQHPPVFEGSSDPLVAEEWLRSIEDIFNFMRLNDHERVLCAIYMLRKDAQFWWDVVKQTLNAEAIVWEEFKAVFNRKYFHPAVLQGKVEEFNNLCQGNLSVTEAIKRFDQLAKLVPHLVTDEREWVRRMMRMFRPGIVTIADTGSTYPTCPKCGKLHPGQCRLRTTLCYTCGKEGHYSRNCPQNTGLGAQLGNKNSQLLIEGPSLGTNARVFTMTKQEAEVEPSTVVSGQLIVASIPAYVLIDS